jgi:alpha-tubulin suppressor-like RCC1 family protein
MTTKILGTQIEAGTIQTEQLAANTTVAFVNKSLLTDYATNAEFAEITGSLAPKITSVSYANSTFTVLDDTAVNTGGGFIVVTGTNFATGATILVDTISASAVTRVSNTTLQVQVPARPAATYNLFVVNPDGGTGIRVNGITYSANPTWVTASPFPSRTRNTIINFNLSATSATSYALANGSTLPAGTALLANGYFYGTSPNIENDTNYTFDVVATDAELQDSPKTFSITITAFNPALLYFFGRGNSDTGLNISVSTAFSSPTQIGTLGNWSSNSSTTKVVAMNDNGIAAIKIDGTLWVWGANTLGELGLRDQIARSSPVQLGTDTNWSSVVNSLNAFISIKKNNTLWSLGGNPSLIDFSSSVSFRSSPTQIGTDTNWKEVSASTSDSSIIAIRTNGTLWAWGENTNGQLGTNNRIVYSSPVQIGTDTDWRTVNMGSGATRNSVMAIKTNGTLWAWGSDSYGNLGLSSIITRSSPVQVGTDTNWSTISHEASGQYATLAVKTNGTLWAWGSNANGGLAVGNNTLTNRRSSPVQLGALTTWKNAQCGDRASYAITTNGQLWAWGNNQYGNVGRNLSGAVYSPIQIGAGTTWDQFYGGGHTVSVGAIGVTKEL